MGLIQLEDAGRMLDSLYTAFARQAYDVTGFPTGFIMRQLVEEKGGRWSCQNRVNNAYDQLWIPFARYEGTIEVVRPYMENGGYFGHKVLFDGVVQEGLEHDVKDFLIEMHLEERKRSKQWCAENLSCRVARNVVDLAEVFDVKLPERFGRCYFFPCKYS